MGNFNDWRPIGKRSVTREPHFPMAKSTAFNYGDVLVLTTVSALTTSSAQVLRPLLAADITAAYQDGSAHVCGIHSICPYTETTNSSGIVATQPSVTNVAAAARPIYALPGVSAGYAVDPNIGHSLLNPIIADSQTWFRAPLLASIGAATAAMVGATAGIDLTSGIFTVDTGATTKILEIVKIADGDPAGNIVYVRVLPAFQQNLTAYPYTAQ